MFDRFLELIISYLWQFSPLLFLGLLVAPLWLSWSHKGEFALSWKDKLTRIVLLFVLIMAVLALASLIADHSAALKWSDVD